MAEKPTILFICTGNAGRSQMAEALCKQMAGDRVIATSAGVEPWANLHPVAVRLLRERGIAMTGQAPKHVRVFDNTPVDLVVTLGDRARELTPELPGAPRRMHWDIADPATFDQAGSTRQEQAFRAALVEIELRLLEALALVETAPLARALHLAPAISTIYTRPETFQPGKHIPLLVPAGFQAIELCCYFGGNDFPWDDPAKLNEAVAVASDYGIRIFSLHAVGDWIVHADPRRTCLMLDLAKASMDAAALVGAGVVAIHARLPWGIERPRGEEVLRGVLAELETHALPMPCCFGWENEAQGLTAAKHLEMLRDYNPGAIGLLLDVGHAHLLGDLNVYLAGAGRRLCSLHIHDNDGQDDLHVLPGHGTFRWDGFVAALQATGYTGPLTLEAQEPAPRNGVPGFLREARAAYDMLMQSADCDPRCY
ncbi:MAG: TIM barrel protein [Armatimonadota bacterium]